MAKSFQFKAGRNGGVGGTGYNRSRFRACLIWQVMVCAVIFLSASFMFSRKGKFVWSTDESVRRTGGMVNVSSPTFFSQNELSREVQRLNELSPRNLDLFPQLKENHVKIVLYVHNRPQYLQIVVDSLSKVEGINETLLIVSHDGWFPEMNGIVEKIGFCQVKQIFALFSPHLYPDSFPGISPGDCQDKDVASQKGCTGDADQYGNHRSKIVSLKHHWWWMMNTVWDGLVENSGFQGHILFIEEDHFIFPNAYRSIQLLNKLKDVKCPECYAANLAPLDVYFSGEKVDALFAEKMGNVGYSFNRTVWNRIHSYSKQFCTFDEYNWDITLWSAVHPNWGDGSGVYTLRGPRASANHFGKCGLHQGQKAGMPPCDERGLAIPRVVSEDYVVNIDGRWDVRKYRVKGYNKAHHGWGGWGDRRDHRLCLLFSTMYRYHV